MKDALDDPATPPPPARLHPRSAFEKVFGKFGLLWVVAFTALATVLRWSTDGLLADSSPFSFYYLSVVLTALVARIGSSVVAVLLGGMCAHFLWVVPRFSWQFLNTAQIAQFVVFILVATLCALAVAAARILRIFDYVLTEDD